MKITAWIGAAFMAVSVMIYLYVVFEVDHTLDPYTPTMDFSFYAPMPFAFLAVLLMVIGGIFGKPKYFWILCLVSSIYCCILMFPLFVFETIHKISYTSPAYRSWPGYFSQFAWGIVPGLLLIITGSVLLFIEIRARKRMNNVEVTEDT